jgi:hypothetical protein
MVASFGLVVLRGAPYVPTKRRDITRAFSELYEIGPDDLLVDIGSGDGIVCRAAAMHGARAVGYELNPVLVAISRWLSREQQQVQIQQKDFWRAKVPADTTIVYTFGDSRDIARMGKWVEAQATRLARPLYFMSYAFELPERTPLRSVGAHHLYQIVPLQDE